MMRRNFIHAKPGQVFATEWPEWHVDCAFVGCWERVQIAELGQAMTIKEAEKEMKKMPDCQGWRKINKFWYCPKHAEEGGS